MLFGESRLTNRSSVMILWVDNKTNYSEKIGEITVLLNFEVVMQF